MNAPDENEHTPARRGRRTRSRRTRLLLRSITAVIAVAVIVGITMLVVNLLADDSPERPSVTASAGGETVTVEPFEYCDPRNPTECDPPGDSADLSVTADTPLTIDVPEAISRAPWSLKRYYVNPQVKDSSTDSLIPEDQYFTPGSTSTVTVPPVDPSGKVLAGVEIQLPTGIVDEATGEVTYISHATWSIKTR